MYKEQLVNREYKLKQITKHFDAYALSWAKYSPVIELYGEAGIGKTRLLNELIKQRLKKELP